jgi:prepilin-type N-terminal cleavage/methylation domain-containing protein
MKTSSSLTRRSAFTLIELLTVIAIIGILAAILIPTVGAVRRTAIKSQCASNLRQLGTAVNLYRNDNKNRIPDGTKPNPRLQWIGTSLVSDLMKYGMTWEMFFCRGNPVYSEAQMTETNRLKVINNPGDTIAFGYVYLPGTTYSATDQYGRARPSVYKQTEGHKITYRLIAADLNRKFNSLWDGGTNHNDGNTPVGGNHLYIDGSVKWVEASRFNARPAMSGDSSDYFFFTEDK